MWTFGATPEAAAAEQTFLEEQILTSPLWQQLDAVRNDRIHFVGDHWIGAGVTAANAILDDLFEHFA